MGEFAVIFPGNSILVRHQKHEFLFLVLITDLLSDRDHWNPGGDGVKWLLNCDFFGHDIGKIASTGELCGGLCVANPECNHFRLHEGFCYLKKAPLSTPRTPINSGMCGFVPYRNFNDSIATCPKIDDLPSECRPIKDCAVWYDQILTIPGTACKLSDGNPGACCPDLPTNSMEKFKFN